MSHFSRLRTARVLVPVLGTGALLAYKSSSENAVWAEERKEAVVDKQLRSTPTSQLVNSLFVYTCCKIPWVVDNSPAILSTLGKIPVISSVTEFAIRHTFFAQFVGGETAFDCLPVIRQLRHSHIGTLLNYSVEVSDDEANGASSGAGQSASQLALAKRIDAEKRIVQTVNAIEVCGYEAGLAKKDDEGEIGSNWIALKFSGLMADPTVLHRTSNTILALRAAYPDASSETYYPGTPTDRELQLMTTTGNTTLTLPNIPDGVSTQDLEELQLLHKDMRLILNKAKECGVRVIIDAEYSWYQPAIDAFQTLLSLEYNKLPTTPSSISTSVEATERTLSKLSPKRWISSLSSPAPVQINTHEVHAAPDRCPGLQPLVYGTYQAYLRRNPEHMHHSFLHAQANNYSLGVKLVRGAYHGYETERWRASPTQSSSGPEPVWQAKEETDKCFNDGLDWLLDHVDRDVNQGVKVPRVGAIFASHNEESCARVIAGMVDRGLAVRDRESGLLRVEQNVRSRICMGQLYGMCDALTSSIAGSFVPGGTPLVLKYLPWGGLTQVVPYLGRRAIENKTVLNGEGGASAETKRVWGELKRRWFGIQ